MDVFCEHNLPVEVTYIHVTKLGRKGPMTCFTKIHISLLLLGQIRWGLSLNCRKYSHSFIIWFKFSDSIKGSFAIDTQMPIVIFLGTICYRPIRGATCSDTHVCISSCCCLSWSASQRSCVEGSLFMKSHVEVIHEIFLELKGHRHDEQSHESDQDF